MKENRISYLIIVFIAVALGIISRKTSFIPHFIGDSLYAVMIYFGILFLFNPLNKLKPAIVALLFCYCIESLQLYNEVWLISLRQTLFGRYVLGQGFLWSDIIAYSIGILIAYYLEKTIIK